MCVGDSHTERVLLVHLARALVCDISALVSDISGKYDKNNNAWWKVCLAAQPKQSKLSAFVSDKQEHA